jgi:hypothetical protein
MGPEIYQYKSALANYRANKFTKCANQLQVLLSDPKTSQDDEIKGLILLNTLLGDWHEVEPGLSKAEDLLDIVRKRHPVGGDEMVDWHLAELQHLLDDLHDKQRQECEWEDVTGDMKADGDEKVTDAWEVVENSEVDHEEAAAWVAVVKERPKYRDSKVCEPLFVVPVISHV